RDERVGGEDDLVPAADAERAQGERDGVGARPDADGLVGLAVRGEVGLEVLDVAAEDERALLRDGAHGAEQLLEQLGVVAVHPDEGHRARRGGGDRVTVAHAAAPRAIAGAESRLASSTCSARRPRWCRPWMELSVRPMQSAISPGVRPTTW